jgi:hypothetical protein
MQTFRPYINLSFNVRDLKASISKAEEGIIEIVKYQGSKEFQI